MYDVCSCGVTSQWLKTINTDVDIRMFNSHHDTKKGLMSLIDHRGNTAVNLVMKLTLYSAGHVQLSKLHPASLPMVSFGELENSIGCQTVAVGSIYIYQAYREQTAYNALHAETAEYKCM